MHIGGIKMSKETIIEEHKEEVRRNRMNKSLFWKWSTLVLGLIIVISLFMGGLPSFGNTQNKDVVAERTVAFINENLLMDIATATLKDVTKEDDLYKIEIDLISSLSNETQNATLYVTKDGNLLFPSAIDLSTFEFIPKNTSYEETTDIKIEAGDDPVIGNPNAKVTIIEFSDFECPYCGLVYSTIKELLAKYPDDVKLVYKNYPIATHEYAQKAAEAGECANLQGAFEEYHNILFEKQDALTVDDLKQYAFDLNLDTEAFNSCLDSGAMEVAVALDKSDAFTAGISGTPTFFINGEKIEGNQPLSVFEEIVNEKLAELSASEENIKSTEEATVNV